MNAFIIVLAFTTWRSVPLNYILLNFNLTSYQKPLIKFYFYNLVKKRSCKTSFLYFQKKIIRRLRWEFIITETQLLAAESFSRPLSFRDGRFSIDCENFFMCKLFLTLKFNYSWKKNCQCNILLIIVFSTVIYF